MAAKKGNRTMWYWIGGMILVIVATAIIASNLTARSHKNYYKKELFAKETEIQRLKGIATEQSAIASAKKEQARELMAEVIKSKKRIRELKAVADQKEQAIRDIPVPQTLKETMQKLKEHGLTPEVRCE